MIATITTAARISERSCSAPGEPGQHPAGQHDQRQQQRQQSQEKGQPGGKDSPDVAGRNDPADVTGRQEPTDMEGVPYRQSLLVALPAEQRMTVAAQHDDARGARDKADHEGARGRSLGLGLGNQVAHASDQEHGADAYEQLGPPALPGLSCGDHRPPGQRSEVSDCPEPCGTSRAWPVCSSGLHRRPSAPAGRGRRAGPIQAGPPRSPRSPAAGRAVARPDNGRRVQ